MFGLVDDNTANSIDVAEENGPKRDPKVLDALEHLLQSHMIPLEDRRLKFETTIRSDANIRDYGWCRSMTPHPGRYDSVVQYHVIKGAELSP
jgi:hypothetical protein